MATRAEWAKRVEQWNKSGLTAAEYGRRGGFDGRQLSWWKWHLSKSMTKSVPHATRRKRAVGSTPAFVPARLVTRLTQPPGRGMVEVVLGNGRIVRVGQDVEAEFLAQVLDVASRSGD